MKKLLSIICLSLFFAQFAQSEILSWHCSGGGSSNTKEVKWHLDKQNMRLNSEAILSNGKKISQSDRVLSLGDNNAIIETDGVSWNFNFSGNLYSVWKGRNITYGNCNKLNTNFASNETENNISFNIKQKKEQCKAIGFKPETEKFADCVLRLVELDVKQQQSNKIAQAQQSGNDALVKQLQRQQYDRGTDALLNLGQQLLNPQTTNSNIYMPQTQRCTIQGFGSFAKMVCR